MSSIHHVMIRGRVQGVGYRAFVEYEASQRGIGGWVRNRRDGTVEVVLAGSEDAIAGVLEACRKGPWGARVDAIDQHKAGQTELSLRRAGESFSVLPTL